MTQTRKLIRRATWRLLLVSAVRNVVWCAAGVLALLTLLVITQRALGFEVPWSQAWWAAPTAACVAALGWTLLTRKRQDAVAREVDARADLREAISTALVVEPDAQDPWSRAVVESAETKAANVKLRQAIPIEPPRAWPIPVAAGLALLIAFMAMPDLDLFGVTAAKTEQARKENEIRLVREELKDTQKRIEELARKAGIEPGKLQDPEMPDTKEPQTPEEIRRSMVRQLTNIQRQLEQSRQSIDMQKQEALQNALRNLRRPGEGPMGDLQRKLARSDFKGAEQALKDLADKVASGELTPQQQQELANQAQNLADQLQRQAQNAQQAQQSLQQALQQQGMTPEQAAQMAQQALSNPQALQQAIQQMQNLSPEQRQALMQMAAQAASSPQLQQVAQQMQQMSECLNPGQNQSGQQSQNGGQQGQSGQQSLNDSMAAMQQMMSDMAGQQSQNDATKESMEQAMAELQAMYGEASGQQGQPGNMSGGDPQIGQWAAGESNSFGGGSGGPGFGNGPSTPDSAGAFKSRREKSKSEDQGGPIIASTFIDGPQLVGESHAQFAEVVENAEQAASEAIETQLVPRERQDLIKFYFGTMSKGAKRSQEMPGEKGPE